MTQPVRITAHLDSLSVGLTETPMMLDGPLSWVWWQLQGSGRIAPGQAPGDAALPLARWVEAGTWGWCVSRAHPQVEAHTAIELRRKPATDAMARYTTDKRFHPGLGPHKARDVTVAAAWVPRVWWDADTTDVDALHALLVDVTHLGAHAAVGYGRVSGWSIEAGVRDGWRDRPMPTEGGQLQRVRPPYWHHGDRVECA